MPSLQGSDLLVGRAVELGRVHDVLRTAASDSRAAVVRIVGGSGIGKSTLLDRVLEEAQHDGWRVAAVRCEPTHRQRPLSALRGVVRALLRSLRGDATRYASGLEAALDAIAPTVDSPAEGPAPFALQAAQAETVLLRLLHGVLHDFPVVVALDDMVHADADSIRTIDYVIAALAECPFVVIVAGPVDSEVWFSARVPTSAIVLRPLPDAEAARIVEAVFPGARAGVTRAIVGYAAGNPLDIATLAENAASNDVETGDGVLDGVRAVVSSELLKVSPTLRRVLQLCSVIPEPVPLQLLIGASQLSESDLLDVVTHEAERYLVRSGTTVRYRHQLIAGAVRATIDNDFVLRRRALDAQLATATSTTDDLERIVELAAQCGERELQREYLMRLGDGAYRSLRFDAAATYYRRAREVRPPRPQEYVSFYLKYTTSLRANDYDDEAIAVLTDALRDGEEQGILDGLGALAAALVATLCLVDDIDKAAEVAEYYIGRLNGPEGLSEVLGSAAVMFAETMQISELQATLDRAAALSRATNYAKAKTAYARGTAASRLGDHEGACRALKSAAFYAGLDRSLLSYNIRFDQLFIDFRHYGNAALRDALPKIAREVSAETGAHAFASYLASFSDFLDGAWERGTARLAELNRARFTSAVRANLLSVPAAMQAFTMQPSSYAEEIHANVDLLVREFRERSAVQLGCWWIAYAASAARFEAETVASRLRKWSLKAPAFGSISFMPVSLALYAQRTGDRDALLELANFTSPHDASLWMEANVALARGVALHALGDRTASAVLRDSSQRFERLGSPFPAGYASALAGAPTPSQLRLLRDLNVTVDSARPLPDATRRGSRPTVRELEIARLVASGRTNRAIAQELFLSERTVEVHIANLFGKLGVTSRTNLARWVYENGEMQG